MIEGDTEKLSWGTGTGAARTATIGGTAVFKAAEKVIEKGRRIAAHMLEAAEEDLEFGDGRSRYETADGREHHHHLIDTRTGAIIEFESEELERLKRKIARGLGYELVGERMELYGVPLDDPERRRK